MKQAPLIDVQPGGTDEEQAIDAAFAQRTSDVRAQKKGWSVDRVEGDDACAERLNELSSQDAIVHEVWFLPERTFVIISWRMQ